MFSLGFSADLAFAGAPCEFLLNSAEGSRVDDGRVTILYIVFRAFAVIYPTLYRLVEKGLITDRSEKVGKRRVRVYYHLETAGEKYLKELKREYISHTAGVLRILGVKDIEGTINDIN